MHSKWLFLAFLLCFFSLATGFAYAQCADWSVSTAQPTESYGGLSSSSISVTNDGPSCITVVFTESGSNPPPPHEFTIPADGEPHIITPGGPLGTTITSVKIKICSGPDQKADGHITF